MIRELNRRFQNYIRPKRLALGKLIWDRKKDKNKMIKEDFIEKNSVKSILFFRPEGKIGDMVITTIFFREIKKRFPYIKIGVVSKKAALDILKYNENIDKTYECKENLLEIKKLTSIISKENYDLLIDFSEDLKVNHMMFINLCEAKFNMGIGKKDWKLFDVSIKKIDDNFHISKTYENMLEKLGIRDISLSYEIKLSEKEEKISRKIKGGYIVFNPYAASKHRSFNEKIILKISRIILEEREENLVLIGVNNNKRELEIIKRELGKRILIPNANEILEVASIIKNSKLVITPDTSIVHIAVAFNKKVIGIYRKEKSDKNFILWGPNSKNSKTIFVEEKIKKNQEIDINKIDINKIREALRNKDEDQCNSTSL